MKALSENGTKRIYCVGRNALELSPNYCIYIQLPYSNNRWYPYIFHIVHNLKYFHLRVLFVIFIFKKKKVKFR